MEDFSEMRTGQRPDSDRNRRERKDADVDMVTVLQPAEMLQSEVELHEAARTNDTDKIRKLFLERVDVNVKNNLDRTALQWAAANGHVPAIELLLRFKCQIEAQDKYGMRALLWAAWFGHNEAIRTLLVANADGTCANKQGMNVLHCAAQNNHLHTIPFLFEAIEDMDPNSVEKNGKTSLHLAAEQGFLKVCDALLTHHVELATKDATGQTAVHAAAAHGQPEVLKKFLLVGTEVDERDANGRTPLHLACEHGQAACVEVLLHANADPNAETKKEASPLMCAAVNGHTNCVATLLDYGCNINSQNNQGNTAVHLACTGSHTEVLRRLIDAYAELDISNSHGKSALQLASRGSFIGLVDMIIKADRYISSNRDVFEPEKEAACNDHYHRCFYGGVCSMQSPKPPKSALRMSQASRLNLQFKRPDHECTPYMKDIIWKLATRQLKSGDWKKLANHWNFTDSQVKAIEHQYTGKNSYKEHGYRLLLIWLHGVKKEDPPMKHLFEALCAIGRRDVAEQVRKKANLQVEKSSSPKFCITS